MAGYGSYYPPAMEQPESSGHSLKDKFSFVENFAGPEAIAYLTMGMMAIGMMSTMMMGGDKRKRRSTTGFEDHITDSTTFYKVISDLDEDDCIALALCHVSSVPLNERSREQIIFSEAFRIDSENPLPWNNRNDNSAKYQYAGFIGQMLNESETQCTTVFPKCQLGPNDVLRLFLQTENDFCNQSIDSENLREDIFNAFLAKRRLPTVDEV